MKKYVYSEAKQVVVCGYGHFHESATTHIDNVIFKMLDIEEMCKLPQR